MASSEYPNEDERAALAQLIEKYGLGATIDALAELARDKGWGDDFKQLINLTLEH